MIFLLTEAGFKLPILSEGLANSLQNQGVASEYRQIGFSWVSGLSRKLLPHSRSDGVSASINVFLFGTLALRNVKDGDIVIIYEGPGTAPFVGKESLYRKIIKKGAKYVFMLPDAWPLTYAYQQDRFKIRSRHASLIACVTPTLVEVVLAHAPGKQVALFEEAIDTDSFNPNFDNENDAPVVVWSGPPSKIYEVLEVKAILEATCLVHPFVLRIVSGRSSSTLDIGVPVEWIPFEGVSYEHQFARAQIAFASYLNYEDKYRECKGNYKIKTYLAAGCATITTPGGYNERLIKDGVTGFFAKDEKEFGQVLTHLLEDVSLRNRVRRNAREFAVNNFGFKPIAKAYLKALDEAGLLPKDTSELKETKDVF